MIPHLNVVVQVRCYTPCQLDVAVLAPLMKRPLCKAQPPGLRGLKEAAPQAMEASSATEERDQGIIQVLSDLADQLVRQHIQAHDAENTRAPLYRNEEPGRIGNAAARSGLI